MHEGNKSHNPKLKANKWLIFTLARIPQGMQNTMKKNSSIECVHGGHIGGTIEQLSFQKIILKLYLRVQTTSK